MRNTFKNHNDNWGPALEQPQSRPLTYCNDFGMRIGFLGASQLAAIMLAITPFVASSVVFDPANNLGWSIQNPPGDVPKGGRVFPEWKKLPTAPLPIGLPGVAGRPAMISPKSFLPTSCTGGKKGISCQNLPAPTPTARPAFATTNDASFNQFRVPDVVARPLVKDRPTGEAACLTKNPTYCYDEAVVVTGDLDNDGDLDLVVGSSTLTILLNDGKGGFTPVGTTITLANTLGVAGMGGGCKAALGDVDGDGDLE